jgi:hypothetical protein
MEKVDLPLVDVLRVRPIGGYKLWLRFSDGSEGIRDFAALVNRSGEMLAPLKDQNYFEQVFIEMGVLTWPNGFDIDPINLYLQMRDARELKRVEAAE